MISEVSTVHRGFPGRTIKSKLGWFGLVLLGFSFFAWATIMTYGERSGFSYTFTASTFMNTSGFATIGATILGLIFVNIGLGSMIRKWKSLVRYTTFFYVWINIMGFYLLYYGRWNGLSFHGFTLVLFTAGTGIVFSFYIILFSLFVIPFLSGRGKLFLSLSVTLNEVFLLLILAVSQWVQANPPAGTMPGPNFPFVLQLINPEFGFPWFQVNFYVLSGLPHWIYFLPVLANSLLGYLYIRPAIEKLRNNSGEWCVDKTIEENS